MLVLDQPFDGLDLKSRLVLADLICEIGEGLAPLLVGPRPRIESQIKDS